MLGNDIFDHFWWFYVTWNWFWALISQFFHLRPSKMPSIILSRMSLMLYYLVMTACRIRVTIMNYEQWSVSYPNSSQENCMSCPGGHGRVCVAWCQWMAAVLNTKESESNLHQSPVSSVLLINYQQSPGTGTSVLTAQGGFLSFLCFFASPWAAVISGYRTTGRALWNTEGSCVESFLWSSWKG